jgi:hypothetical protein
MKRKAILIGNTNGLQGVQVDLNNYKKFLKSEIGGAWLDSEILTLKNPSLTILNMHILNIKMNERPDFVFLVYTGHGGYIRKATVFEINEKHETIEESKLWNIAKRQISISDCCRGIDTDELSESVKLFSDGGKIGQSQARLIYDKRIMESEEQQARFYSCSIGEPSIDTGLSGGGLYTKNLLKAIKETKFEKYLTINDAHEVATRTTKKEALETEQHNQTPDSRVISCFHDKQLIIAINPVATRLFG